MQFHSPEFLVFFPIVTLLYFVIPRSLRLPWLLAASYFFCLCWDAPCALVLLLVTAVSWAAGLLVERKKSRLLLGVGIVVTLAALLVFKYTDFILGSLPGLAAPRFDLVLPLGISFYTFQAVGYLVDVWRGKVSAERDLLRYALFLAFFPKLVSGPIERAGSLLEQMRAGTGDWGLDRPFDFEEMRRGLLLMAWGLFLKLVAADRAALLVDTVFPDYGQYNGLQLAVAAVFFSVQIYCDFAGYSAIAIGAARVMGFRLADNFCRPYLALSVRDFWRRWHISLSAWFRDYLYIPLGGNRKGTGRKYLNLMITFLVSGLWHGASWHFVVWGGLHGAYQVAGDATRPLRDRACERLKLRREVLPWRIVRGLFTFGLVTVAWVFFRAESTGAALGLLWGIVSRFTLSPAGITTLGLDRLDFLALLAAIVVVLIADLLAERGVSVGEKILTLPLPLRWAVYYLAVFSILIFGIYGGNYDAGAFIYGDRF